MIRHAQQNSLKPSFVKEKLKEFFKEDKINEDITTTATQKENHTVKAEFIAKENLMFAGKEIIIQAFDD